MIKFATYIKWEMTTEYKKTFAIILQNTELYNDKNIPRRKQLNSTC